MGIGAVIDKITLAIIIGVLAYGVFETTQDLGGFDSVLSQAIEDPKNSGIGTVFFALGFDIWVPAYPHENFGIFAPIMNLLYFYTGGYVPSFSLWVFVPAIIVAGIGTFFVIRFLDWDLFGKAGIFALVIGVITYYICQFIGWLMLGAGGEMLGFNAYSAWESAVNATLNPIIFWFLLATIPLSFYSVGKRVGGAFF